MYQLMKDVCLGKGRIVLIAAVIQRCSVKKVFLRIPKTLRKTPVSESLF